MKKNALFSLVTLILACSFIPDVAMAETNYQISERLLAQSTAEEPQSSEDFLDSLELTEEQKSQIKIISDEYRPEINATFRQRQSALEVLNNTVNPDVSSNKIRITRASFNHLNLKLRDLLFEELMAVRDVLTVEQREQINQRLNELLSASQVTP